MRIAIIAAPHVAVPPMRYGGSEQVIHYLIKGLKELGHQPTLLASGDSKVDCPLIPIVDKALGFPRSAEERKLFEPLERAAQQRTTDILNNLRPHIDLIHSHGFDLLPFADIPNLTTLHCKVEFEQLEYYRERRDKLYYASISKNQQKTCPDLQYMGVVYNGEDTSGFPIVTEPEDYVCFLGRFDREKAPHTAIQLALALGIKIKLAGKIDVQGEHYFEHEVAKYFDHPLVEYIGELGFDDKVELLSKARCNLHPISFREPFGLTVTEAAYCGTPTLAVRRGSMSELIEDGRTGRLVEDFVEGYQVLKDCFEMDRTYIASRARQLFHYKTMTKQYLTAYSKVISHYSLFRQAQSVTRTITDNRRLSPGHFWQTTKANLPL